jgi:hypothetical protein
MRQVMLIPSGAFFLNNRSESYPITFIDGIGEVEGGYIVTNHFRTMDRKHEFVFKQSCNSENCNPEESPF